MRLSKGIALGLGLIAASTSALATDVVVFSVGGDVRNPTTWSLAEIQALPGETLTVVDEHATQADYRCTSFLTLLGQAGTVSGKEIKGERLTDYILASGADNYRVLFSLSEIDALLGNHPAFVCYAKNGASIPEKEGPLRIIVPNEARHARWVRHVMSLEVGNFGSRN